MAEYAEANQLIREPAFTWWAPAALRKRKHIIKQLKTRYHRHTEKFGLELPKTVKRALEIDEETGTTFRCDALHKEMGNIEPCMKVLGEGEQPLPLHQFIHTHIVFDIKMDSTRKTRFVVNGSTTEVDVNPNRDSPNGYPTVKRAKLQPITLAHEVDAHKTFTAHKLACSCFVTPLWSSVEQAISQATQRPSQPHPHTTIPLTPLERTKQPSQHLLHVIPSIPFTHTSQSGNSNNTTTQTQTPSSTPTTSHSSPKPHPH